MKRGKENTVQHMLDKTQVIFSRNRLNTNKGIALRQ